MGLFSVFEEIAKIGVVAAGYAVEQENGGAEAQIKRQRVIDTVKKEVRDEGGIYVTNKWVLMGLDFLTPLIVDYVVGQLNKVGFFAKSTD